MFLSHELITSKKKFQKPNILRKRPKVSIKKAEAPSNVSSRIPISIPQNETINDHPIKFNIEISTPAIDNSFQNVQNYLISSSTKVDNDVPSDIKLENVISDGKFDNNIAIHFDNNVQIDSSENFENNSINVEAFLNGADQLNTSTALQKNDEFAKEYWCFELVDGVRGTIINTNSESQLSNVEQGSNVCVINPSSSLLSGQNQSQCMLTTVSTSISSTGNFSNSCFRSRAIKFKCDVPNCKKGFTSELKLKKHKDTHNKQSKIKTSQITAECPAKKINEEGVEVQCGKIYLTTEDLLKHLNEDHAPDESIYVCTECGVLNGRSEDTCRRSKNTRSPLMCSWPGCGRVFQQPCRLREHARAHTGDRPYPCLFPECGWSFRSKSKLLRHARRHTGERRHECSECGRAFLRREHLRDHCARTHPDRAPDDPPLPAKTPSNSVRTCTYEDCGKTFSSASALSNHFRKIHKKVETSKNSSAASKKGRSNMFVVNLVPDSENEDAKTIVSETTLAERSIMEEMGMDNSGFNYDAVESGGECFSDGIEGQSARTHCTWPLAARNQPLYEHPLNTAYVFEEDTPVEQSESSESNIYTIRSDLFLHGNVLINEDSESIVSREYLGRSSGGISEGVGEGEDTRDHSVQPHVLDAGLDLIDAHPIDLMQDELMYSDAAVDESSFRVFFA